MKLKLTATIALLSAIAPFSAHADIAGDHPGYMHALKDLSAARWNLQHRPGEVAVSTQEYRAISEIDRAIGEVKKAAHDDGKDIEERPHEDPDLDRPGRLHRAVDLLEKAHGELDREEDNAQARGPKHRALDHVDHAIEAARRAIQNVERARASAPQ
jgi:hypothetical protein